MQYEVEQKFWVENFVAIEGKLAALGTTIKSPITQVDSYFAHPARDFSQTDEALRIRRVGDSNCITYKGPRIDTETKTRQELELALPSGGQSADSFGQLLCALGFSPVAEVHKQRRAATVQWEDQHLELALDEVQDVGTFIEIELVVDEGDLEVAKSTVRSLASHLGLQQAECRSYLELLLEAK